MCCHGGQHGSCSNGAAREYNLASTSSQQPHSTACITPCWMVTIYPVRASHGTNSCHQVTNCRSTSTTAYSVLLAVAQRMRLAAPQHPVTAGPSPSAPWAHACQAWAEVAHQRGQSPPAAPRPRTCASCGGRGCSTRPLAGRRRPCLHACEQQWAAAAKTSHIYISTFNEWLHSFKVGRCCKQGSSAAVRRYRTAAGTE